MPIPKEIEEYVAEKFVRSSGPGGQHANKVSTGVRLEFDIDACPIFADDVRSRLITLAGKRYGSDGSIVITSTQHRSQKKNRREVRRRLADLIETAQKKPKLRKKTRRTLASKERRLISKKRRSETKLMRRKPPIE